MSSNKMQIFLHKSQNSLHSMVFITSSMALYQGTAKRPGQTNFIRPDNIALAPYVCTKKIEERPGQSDFKPSC